MDIVLRVIAGLVGISLVIWVLLSVIRTFMLPRSANDRLARFVFLLMRRIYDFFVKRSSYYERRDRIMAFYVPVSLLILLAFWLMVIQLGYTLIYLSLGVDSLERALIDSGSSMLTLGFASLPDLPTTFVAFTEALIGLIMVALLISFIPTLYSAFSKRESAVNMLEVRAGKPPSALELIKRFHRLQRLDKLNDLWVSWELWFVELQETHTSFSMLAFFRSPDPQHSWITAAGTVLDAASMVNSTLEIPKDAQSDLCIRAGYLALQNIASLYQIPFEPKPKRTDPISITREEFYEAYENLAREGVPVRVDRELAWEDFAGWRVNYDRVLVALAGLLMAPPPNGHPIAQPSFAGENCIKK